MDFWFQDEARIGQQNTTTHLWSLIGNRPRAVKQQQFDYAYLFGAVCPATGATEALIAPYVDKDINNVSIMKLPPYSPELNPIEQVWSWLRQHHLANRCFSGYDDIVDACTLAWNDFINDIKRVTQMCSRDWLDERKT